MSVLYQLHITRTEWAVIYTCHVCNIFECIIFYFYATEVNRVITCSSVCPSQAVNSLCTYVTMSVSKSRVSLLLSVTFNVM